MAHEENFWMRTLDPSRFNRSRFNRSSFNRRETLALLGTAGAAVLAGSSFAQAASSVCLTPNPALEEGPYFVEEKLLRSDLRTDLATGVVQAGALLTLAITLQNQAGAVCTPLVGAHVDIWQANWDGVYSDESMENTVGQKYLRGYQITDDNGLVQFTTVYPGWYPGRTVHIHLRVRTYSGTTVVGDFETQAFFNDTLTNQVYAQSPYNARGARDTLNANDRVYNGAGNIGLNIWTVTATATGYAAGLNLAVSLAVPAAATPVVTSGGVVNAASGAAGVAPGSWVSIFGSNLSAATYTLASGDIVNNTMPATLNGVSVQIDSKPAFMYYLSLSQINVLAPADANTGSVPVTVTNSSGTSAAVTATLQPLLPAFFVVSSGASNYVQAVRSSDGAIVNGTGAAVAGYTTAAAAHAGDSLELYGTGFGPTITAVAAGSIFSGAYPTAGSVTVTVGGVTALVSFAGLVGPGLYQINLTVPSGLESGDNKVVATVGGVSSPSTALLKIS
jgi:uncharacterized protein (TIGR03437 family)